MSNCDRSGWWGRGRGSERDTDVYVLGRGQFTSMALWPGWTVMADDLYLGKLGRGAAEQGRGWDVFDKSISFHRVLRHGFVVLADLAASADSTDRPEPGWVM